MFNDSGCMPNILRSLLTTMNIVFDPPIGQTIHVGSLSTRPTVLVFTARLSAHDHDRLVRDGGRVQLWGDIPEKGQSYGIWRALDFEASPDRADDEYVVSLGSSPLASARDQETVLFLVVCSPERFQFTYRILYPSGSVVWLGQYGRNASMVFNEGELELVDGLELTEGWTFNRPRRLHVLDKNQASRSDILRFKNVDDIRVLALTKEGFQPNFESSRLLFFIPRVQPHLAIRPTYVVATSPGLSATVSVDGRVTVSGSGVAILSTHDFQSDPGLFIQQFLQHSDLLAWNVLTHNAGFPAVILGSCNGSHRREIAIIPLWPSDFLQYLHHLPMGELSSGLSGTGDLKKLALFSPYNLTLHIFDEDSSKQNVSLQFDSANNQFTLCPIYELQSPVEGPSQKIWAAAVLTPHLVVQSPQQSGEPLPTPPPSPSLKPVAHPTQSRASIDTIASSVDTLPSDIGISLKTSGEPDDHKLHGTAASTKSQTPSRSSALKLVQRPAPTRSILFTLIRTFFSALAVIFRIIFWFRIVPLWLPRLRLLVRRFAGDRSLEKVAVNKADDPPEINGNGIVGSPASTVSDKAGSNEMLFMKLYREADSNTSPTTASIILLTLGDTLSSAGYGESATDSGPRPTSASGEMESVEVEHMITFLAASDSGSTTPECAVSLCEMVIMRDWGDVKSRRERRGSCYLLEYQMDWEDGQDAKLIRISRNYHGY